MEKYLPHGLRSGEAPQQNTREFVNLGADEALGGGTGSEAKDWSQPDPLTSERKT